MVSVVVLEQLPCPLGAIDGRLVLRIEQLVLT